MTKAVNPFKPTAGMNPPELIGRDTVLDDFAEALENGPGAPDRLMRISGVRGTGKTVLLNALGDLARKKGFEVVADQAVGAAHSLGGNDAQTLNAIVAHVVRTAE